MLASRDSWPFYLPADNPHRNPFPIESISRKPYHFFLPIVIPLITGNSARTHISRHLSFAERPNARVAGLSFREARLAIGIVPCLAALAVLGRARVFSIKMNRQNAPVLPKGRAGVASR